MLSYLLAPSNFFFLKGIFVGFDMVTCGALALLLMRKGLDPRRVVIYAWCPLPIVEFATQGHLDAATITFTVLTVLSAASNRRGALESLTVFHLEETTNPSRALWPPQRHVNQPPVWCRCWKGRFSQSAR